MKKLSTFFFRLYHTNIKYIESYVIMNQKFDKPKNFVSWRDRLDHHGSSMMRRTIEHSHGHPLKHQEILLPNECPCAACSQGKLIVKPSFSKVTFESPFSLEIIHGTYIYPSHGPFRYFMVLIDASMRCSHVYFVSTRNVAFDRLLAQMIKL